MIASYTDVHYEGERLTLCGKDYYMKLNNQIHKICTSLIKIWWAKR
jgi:hypothetical protein